ncbi:hypothetical protein SLS55_006855 [Diplodia seriata]|uniref:Fungal specific transcription n=1 Tax=Diplodia seriata TaxID=420778 RepID=A0ABR3CAP8_9PEZI
MQRLYHRAAAAAPPLLTKNAASSPFVSRLNRLFAQNSNNVASSSPYSTTHPTTTMSSSSANPNPNPNAHTIDADSFHPKNHDDNNNNKAGGEQDAAAALPLPAPPGEGSAEALRLELGADGVKLDALGPMVVNSDGSLSRIANWERMAEIERRNTLRVIGKRNRERLARLRGE